jgi:hypothetical protein
MKEYQVKVTEKHCDYVWVKASSEEEAKELAPAHASCEFESLYDCEVVAEEQSNE